jgi:integrase
MKTLVDLARHYVDNRNICGEYRQTIGRIAASCPTLSADAVNAYLKRRLTEVSTITARNERGIILSLWVTAYHDGVVDTTPRGIMKIKVRRAATRAWTLEEVKTVLSHARKQRGIKLRCGADKADFLSAWILLGYESGARFGDCWSFTREHIVGDALQWTQSKTGDPLSKILTPACLEACSEMLKKSPDGRIIGWVCGKRHATRIMRQHLASCELPGTSKWLRRSGATHVEMVEPGRARLHLGHRSVGLAEKAYLDWAQIRTKTPRVPALID